MVCRNALAGRERYGRAEIFRWWLGRRGLRGRKGQRGASPVLRDNEAATNSRFRIPDSDFNAEAQSSRGCLRVGSLRSLSREQQSNNQTIQTIKQFPWPCRTCRSCRCLRVGSLRERAGEQQVLVLLWLRRLGQRASRPLTPLGERASRPFGSRNIHGPCNGQDARCPSAQCPISDFRFPLKHSKPEQALCLTIGWWVW